MGNPRRAAGRNTDLVDGRSRANLPNGGAHRCSHFLITVLSLLTNHERLDTEISKERASKLGLFTSILGHVGDGNFHQIVMYDPAKPEQQKAVEECVNTMMIEALKMEGTVSVSNTLALHPFTGPG